jgi:hypothetical protein
VIVQRVEPPVDAQEGVLEKVRRDLVVADPCADEAPQPLAELGPDGAG